VVGLRQRGAPPSEPHPLEGEGLTRERGHLPPSETTQDTGEPPMTRRGLDDCGVLDTPRMGWADFAAAYTAEEMSEDLRAPHPVDLEAEPVTLREWFRLTHLLVTEEVCGDGEALPVDSDSVLV